MKLQNSNGINWYLGLQKKLRGFDVRTYPHTHTFLALEAENAFGSGTKGSYSKRVERTIAISYLKDAIMIYYDCPILK